MRSACDQKISVKAKNKLPAMASMLFLVSLRSKRYKMPMVAAAKKAESIFTRQPILPKGIKIVKSLPSSVCKGYPGGCAMSNLAAATISSPESSVPTVGYKVKR